MRIFVAGPIGVDYIRNAEIAVDAADRLLLAGHQPYVPHLCGYWHLRHFHDYNVWTELSLAWLRQCEAVVRLPGESPGADREVAEATVLGLPVYSIEEALTIGGANGPNGSNGPNSLNGPASPATSSAESA